MPDSSTDKLTPFMYSLASESSSDAKLASLLVCPNLVESLSIQIAHEREPSKRGIEKCYWQRDHSWQDCLGSTDWTRKRTSGHCA